MKVFKSLFAFLVFILVFSNYSFSQSSIYQDAKELANFLKKDRSVIIKIQQENDNSPTTVFIKKERALVAMETQSSFTLPDFDRYHVTIPNWQAKDSLLFIFPDTTFVFGREMDTLLFNPEYYQPDTTSGAEEELLSGNEAFFIQRSPFLIELTKFKDYKEITGMPFHTFYSKGISSEDYIKIFNILFSNSNKIYSRHNYTFNIQSIQSNYLTNPFINNLNFENPILKPSFGESFEPSFFSAIEDDFLNFYFKKSPWQNYLYGDSLLQLERKVSFKDANISYRKRIVTSQKELEFANTRINRTNQSRGILDAKTVAVGLSDFIAERAQEELNLTFFHRFKKNLDKPSELTVLFPETKKLLQQFEISDYKTLLSYARESFEVDLENLGLHFPDVLELPKYKKLYNSPEVFNLALIYSIADLAYKEEPIENILLSGYQKLQERKRELKRSINIQLADHFLGKHSVKTESGGSPSQELDLLKKYVKEYLSNLNAVHDTISSFQKFLTTTQEKQSNNYRTRLYFNNNTEFSNLRKYKKESSSGILKLNRTLEKDVFYNNRKIPNINIPKHFSNIIDANLKGKNYYGYVMKYPQPEDYELYFKNQSDSTNSILAQGLEEVRTLLDEGLSLEMELQLSSQKDYANTLIQDLNYITSQGSPIRSDKAKQLGNMADYLEKAISREIVFWEKVTRLDHTDQQIAGLYFLKSLLKKDIYIQLFRDAVVIMEKNGLNFSQLMRGGFFKNSFELEFFKTNYTITKDRIDSIFVDVEHRLASLEKEFGNLTLGGNSLKIINLEIDLQQDTVEINRSIDQLHKQKLKELIYIEGKIVVDSDQLKNLSTQLDQLNQSLRTTSEDAQKEELNNKIDQLNDKRDIIVEKIEEGYEIQKAELEKKYTLKVNALNDKKQLRLQQFNQEKAKVPQVVDDTTILQTYYSRDNNPYFSKYEIEKNRETGFGGGMKSITNQISNQYLQTQAAVNNLQKQAEKINGHLNYLERKYCKDLVNAENNAMNLAKGLEVAAHLLFAFRNYETRYDTIYFQDTSRLEITKSKLDTFGYTNITTVDSFRIIKKPILDSINQLVDLKWISKSEFEKLRRNEVQWNIFLGLLYQRLNTIEDIPNFSAEGVALLATKFLDITNNLDNYQKELSRKKVENPESISFKDYYPFIRSTVDLFNIVITTPSVGSNSALISQKMGLRKVPRISNEALSLYENIYVKEYGNAVLNAMELLKIITENQLDTKENRRSQRAINAVLTYGTFMANMINAETSDQVKNILRSTTLPPGSSRIKRETVTNFTINSYLGAGIGRDRLINVPSNIDITQDAFGASLSVPIGFTYSFSPKWIKNKSSFSFHVPLLDLGALTAYRQNPNNTTYSIDDLPDFSWENLFSPGLFAVYNFANSPFSLGVGGQYGPQLREITLNTGEAINVNSWRFPMAFFTIDVPFFNLHTGARKIIVD